MHINRRAFLKAGGAAAAITILPQFKLVETGERRGELVEVGHVWALSSVLTGMTLDTRWGIESMVRDQIRSNPDFAVDMSTVEIIWTAPREPLGRGSVGVTALARRRSWIEKAFRRRWKEGVA